MYLYHATSLAAARQIDSSREFKPGTRGFAGSAIYFSKTERGAERHCFNGKGSPDVTICCWVELGRCAHAKKNTMDRRMCEQHGYDSVKIAGTSTYAVFDSNRIYILHFKVIHTGLWSRSLDDSYRSGVIHSSVSYSKKTTPRKQLQFSGRTKASIAALQTDNNALSSSDLNLHSSHKNLRDTRDHYIATCLNDDMAAIRKKYLEIMCVLSPDLVEGTSVLAFIKCEAVAYGMVGAMLTHEFSCSAVHICLGGCAGTFVRFIHELMSPTYQESRRYAIKPSRGIIGNFLTLPVAFGALKGFLRDRRTQSFEEGVPCAVLGAIGGAIYSWFASPITVVTWGFSQFWTRDKQLVALRHASWFPIYGECQAGIVTYDRPGPGVRKFLWHHTTLIWNWLASMCFGEPPVNVTVIVDEPKFKKYFNLVIPLCSAAFVLLMSRELNKLKHTVWI
eukprot:TRINITY_DN26170_c0_g1_i2.p1 TRINITY_DN26170_c0_g1~~TRINITY_DN26170_c0_g1_i2.p1  ORF type:complete len:448 (+),score=5.76 TRINITY_DN26170_c0_g1_i2:181-1524(+)